MDQQKQDSDQALRAEAEKAVSEKDGKFTLSLQGTDPSRIYTDREQAINAAITALKSNRAA
jgi:hypothetical protein